MNNTFEHAGLTFRYTLETDLHMGAPWDEECDHGDVREARRSWKQYPEKQPGELILRSGGSRSNDLFYDFAGACRRALRDRWGARGAEPGMTKRQIAALAAREDYEFLRAWCDGRWSYVVIYMTLLDIDGDDTDFCDCLGGVYCDNGSIDEAAYLVDMAHNIIAEAGLNVDGVNSVTRGATTQIVRED